MSTHSPSPDLRWSDALVLGYAPLDHVHEEFVETLAVLRRCVDTELGTALSAFIAHAESHFELEDRWMRDTEFPPRDCHIEEHAAVLKSAYEVRDLLAGGDFAVTRSFAEELARWFPGHATHLDSALSHWMFKRQHAGKPIVLRRAASSNQPVTAGDRGGDPMPTSSMVST